MKGKFRLIGVVVGLLAGLLVTPSVSAGEKKVGAITGRVENGAGMEVSLYDFAISMEIASTTTDADGNYVFQNIPTGSYLVFFGSCGVGSCGAIMLSVRADEETVAPPLYQVVKGDTLWGIFGPRPWSRFIKFADGRLMKYFVTNDADALLVVIIQPGWIFSPMTEMSPSE